MRCAQPVDSIAALALPETLRPWLQLETSLTQKLGQSVGTKPGLIVLGEGLEQGNAWESDTLGTTDAIYARHIALTINDDPVVLARSMTTQGAGMDALTGLRTRPLAELLFEDPLWQRGSAIQYLRLTDQIPGRSCCWHHQKLGADLIVQEFFLPNLAAAIGI
jgi:chorismate-pyruvate lyase